MRIIINPFFLLSLCLNLGLGMLLDHNRLHAAADSPGPLLFHLDFSTFPDDIRQGLKDSGFSWDA